MPAAVAGFGERIPFLHIKEVSGFPVCLILQQLAEGAKTRIHDRLPKAQASGHVPKADVLQADDIIQVRQLPAFLMSKIQALVMDFLAQLLDLQLFLSSVMRILLLPAELVLQLRKPLLRLMEQIQNSQARETEDKNA